MRNSWRERSLDQLAGMGAVSVTGLSVVLLASIGLLDWFSEADIAASLGYLLPLKRLLRGKVLLQEGKKQ